MKTIIHVWTNNCCNIKYNPEDTSSYWGLGDLIRGTIKLFQLQRYLKFQLIVDISLHPIAEFIEKPIHNYSNLIKQQQNNIPYYYIDTLKPYLLKTLNNNEESQIILLTTNDKNIETLPITTECKEFIKKLFIPNPEFHNYLNEIINNLPIQEYNIFHIRLGDDFLVKKTHTINNYNELITKFISSNNLQPEKHIIITDNKELKEYIKNNTQLYTLNTNICHIGLNQISNENIRDTLVEFFLLQYAQEITTFSIYHWISGFVQWSSKIYDIPIIVLNNKFIF